MKQRQKIGLPTALRVSDSAVESEWNSKSKTPFKKNEIYLVAPQQQSEDLEKGKICLTNIVTKKNRITYLNWFRTLQGKKLRLV